VKVDGSSDGVMDVPIILESNTTEDSYDGDFVDRREIITTFTFTAKVNLYQATKGIDYAKIAGIVDECCNDGEVLGRIKKVIIDIPQGNTRYTAQVVQASAEKEDLHKVIESENEMPIEDLIKNVNIHPEYF
jgi:GTP cyclohydrolase FolE2